jgi:hypothetical protein
MTLTVGEAARTHRLDVPGVYLGLPDEVYHADPVVGSEQFPGSLSSTEVRALLDCPAAFRWLKDNRRPDTKAFDWGHAAHRRVLGRGMECDVHPDPEVTDRKRKDVQDWERKVRAAGRVPLLAHEDAVITAMAERLRADPKAGPLLDPGRGGEAEATGVAQDPETGVWLRTRVDWLPPDNNYPEFKTTSKPPTLWNIARIIAEYRYHVQAAHNLRTLQLAGWPVDPETARWFLIFQCVKPPYIVTTVDLDLAAIQKGLRRQRKALARYVDCVLTGRWPGYTDDLDEIPTVGLPPWADRDEDDDMEGLWT